MSLGSKLLRGAAAQLAALWLSAPAVAATVQATYCVDYLLDFTDGSTGDLYTGTDGPARGVKLEFSAHGVATQYAYTDYTGADPGCASVDIDNSPVWTVKVVADALVDGNTVRVLDGIGGTPRKTTWLTNHTPQDNVVYSTNIGPSGTTQVMGVAAFALFRHSAGLSGETFDFVLEQCVTTAEVTANLAESGTSCYRSSLDEIRISNTQGHEDYKFIIAREMGHAVSHYANDGAGQDSDDAAPVGDCGPFYDEADGIDDGHGMPEKEFSSLAAVEGIAHFWSALAFNNVSSTADCEVEKHYFPDWDHDGSNGGANDVKIFSCSGAIVVNSVTVAPEFDYYSDFCTGAGAQTNRSTEYDWLEALWDARTQGGMTGAQIYDIWNAANPNSWNENGIGSGGDFPAARMSSGAYAVGGSTLQTTWDTWAGFNGIDR